MEPTLLEILRCPVCRAELTLEGAREEDGEVVAGELVCTGCRERYPIEDGIPNLLPPDQRERG
ncbi:methytransferase partner Trm112 [Tepidiforma sp.]|uniref:methytransferase partner Trm112 n=1 Tax=Tepidiforma sp. TaxID=2682230 RepID=UPI002ADE4797|nr:methytransferase partner Trm112 [Tepidiforma sp.]